MSEPTFEQKLRTLAENSLIKLFSEGQWIEADYKNRVKIPPDFMQEVWALVDREKVKKALAKRIEAELADRLINHIAAEMATDIKQILSVQERREAVRALAREHLERIMALGKAEVPA